jgi:hypothetical protein
LLFPIVIITVHSVGYCYHPFYPNCEPSSPKKITFLRLLQTENKILDEKIPPISPSLAKYIYSQLIY